METTQEQARAIAADGLRSSEYVNSHEIGDVLLRKDLSSNAPLVYGLRTPLKDCWIVYLDPKNATGIHSSAIMLIERSTGSLIYLGSAGDEG